uniref:UDENN domain-containing protein n=1 Tax=Ditylenchus dipsaci TaxID=166011 RepID=A0A915ETD1_9BILA
MNHERGNEISQLGLLKSEAAAICPGLAERAMQRISYKPGVLVCYPTVKDADKSLVRNVPIFCLPKGVSIKYWYESQRDEEKLFSTCVLTDEKGTKFYGASLSFYENYTKTLTEYQLKVFNEGYQSVDESNGNIKQQKASYRHSENFSSSSTKLLPAAAENSNRALHIIHDARSSFPSSTRPRVLVQLGNDSLVFDHHDDSQIPRSGAMFVVSLKNLGSENFILAMLLALLEQKIVFHSVRPVHTYLNVHLLLLEFFMRAVPFIAGVDSIYFSNQKPPSDVTCFDLDTGTVAHSEYRKSLKINLLPQKPLKNLKSSLDSISRQLTEGCEPLIREAFLRFMCSLMRNQCTDTTALFNVESFLWSRDKHSFDFYKRFFKTQCFNRFIEERSFVSDKKRPKYFFDDCISKIMREKSLKTELRLLDYDMRSSKRTFVVPPPKVLSGRAEKIAMSSPVDILPESDILKNWAIRTTQELKASMAEATTL